MQPEELSHELRHGQSADLRRRRWIVGLSMVGSAISNIVSLYQMGMIRRLPDPPLPYLDSSKVDASPYAYSRLRTPDGLMMMANYAATAWLAGVGGERRAEESPALPVAMGIKTLVDAAMTARLDVEEWRDNKALCTYCQVAMVCSFAAAALALPETLKGLKNLRGQQPQQRSARRWSQRAAVPS